MFSRFIIMDSVVSKELDYKKVNYVHPTYRMNRIFAQSGSTTQTINTAGGQENIYEIPIAPFNLSRSYFTFTASIPETTTGGNKFNFVFRDVFSWWRQLQIYTRGGIYLMDLNELANYTKVVWKAELNLLEFLDLDTDIAGATSTATTGASAMLQRTNATTAVTDRPTGGTTQIANGNVVSSSSSIAYTENRYLTASAVADGAGAGNLVINVSLPLRLLKNTICAVDKDIYTGEILLFRIVWQSTQKIYFANVTNDGKYATTDDNAIPAPNSISISNMALYLATEKNQMIVNDLMSKVSSGGYQMLIPYVYTMKSNLIGTNVSTSLRFNRGHGKNLQKIYYAVFNGTESSYSAYDNNNVVGTVGGGYTGGAGTAGANPVTQNFYTLLNNVRIQEYNMTCNALDDYKLLQDKLKGTITQNSNIYYYNHFWVDDFCDVDKLWQDTSNYDCGIDLSIEAKWDIYLTLSNNLANIALNHYAFAITQKVLSISPTGVTVL